MAKISPVVPVLSLGSIKPKKKMNPITKMKMANGVPGFKSGGKCGVQKKGK